MWIAFLQLLGIFRLLTIFKKNVLDNIMKRMDSGLEKFYNLRKMIKIVNTIKI